MQWILFLFYMISKENKNPEEKDCNQCKISDGINLEQ